MCKEAVYISAVLGAFCILLCVLHWHGLFPLNPWPDAALLVGMAWTFLKRSARWTVSLIIILSLVEYFLVDVGRYQPDVRAGLMLVFFWYARAVFRYRHFEREIGVT
jgi:hypothetical protein